MTCPFCGAVESDVGGRCGTCQTPLPIGFSDNDVTRVSPTADTAATVVSAAADDDRTVVTAPAAPFAAAPRRDTGPLAVGEAFGARYHPIRVLGVGGMGAVYHVWDTELGQDVALKVIRPETSGDSTAAREMERRFKQELVLARQVTHKNVVRIHDLGEINGVKYITMPYLNGSDLASVLKKEGKLPVRTALRIVRDVASGLVAAHEAGVVHRDLKPPNIMLVGDQAIIMDFGIARSTGAPSMPQPAAQSLPSQMEVTSAPVENTMAGTILGTVEYMAPEQAKGEAVDQRADIYALGLIFSDLLLGRRRLEGTIAEELKRRIEQAPPKVRTIDASIPETTERIIARCCEPDPAARFQTSAELVAELDRLDEDGRPLPIHRVVGMKVMVASVALFTVLIAGTWWFARGPAVPVQHDPVAVLIADFDNGTGDQTFDRTLEPMVKMALEGAGFISAHSRIDLGRNLGVRPPEQFNEGAARQMAIQQGLGVVLSGSIKRQGSRYAIAVKASQAVTGEVIAEATETASNKDEVLPATTELANTVREALGDEQSDSTKRFAMEALSATSLDVVREYAAAMDALSRGQFDEARQRFAKTLTLDRNFGLGYLGLATTSRNLDRQQEAQAYAKQAVSHVDSMTERERYRTRGMYYLITNDYQSCVKEYGDLISRYAADAAARNNLALCATYLRDLPKALDEMRQVVKILPNRALYRTNLALYSNYSGDFQAGEHEARAMTKPGMFGLLALALSQVGQGFVPLATETYESIGQVDPHARSYMTSGLGDLAAYEGRFSDAERILGDGAAADLAAKEPNRAAAKFAALGYARLQRGRKAPAVAAANDALANSSAVKVRFLAARILVEAGEIPKAQTLAAALGAEMQTESQAYAKIIDGLIALDGKDPRQAIKLITDANNLLDTWLGHFDLGRAYLDAGAPLQADSEFDRCLKRRGEALALFLDEEPTYAYFPPVYYYQGRVREALNATGFANSYRAYLAIRGSSKEDPLLPDVRRRAGQP